eukprot:TRINITY_DN47226_c0_g1_i1.p1 TRINITY_DN47226_c0_g1~~TRINITY_DN47226_c0_g1_i1.p1  ORF type:complete len:336 (+),score=73.56 TRINITY_DN47226_c0_g1_i1:53-1060(+)
MSVTDDAAPKTAPDDGESQGKERAYIDEFGFLVNTQAAQPPPPRQRDRDQEAQKTDQWMRMLSRWPQTVSDYPTLRRRVRRGLPCSLRGYIWQMLLGSRALGFQMPGLYEELQKREMDRDLAEIARRDLARTFPMHSLFLGADGVGQRQLFRVLSAFAVYDPRVGYCQGMGFVAATLLTQMPEEDAFWAFLVLMKSERYDLAGLYLPGFPLVQRSFAQLRFLLGYYCPRLAEHLNAEGVDVSFFASQWFMTLFVYQFPFRLLLPVWDLFILDRWKAVMRVSLALLMSEEEALRGMTMEGILRYMKQIHEGRDPRQLIHQACGLKMVTNRRLERIR